MKSFWYGIFAFHDGLSLTKNRARFIGLVSIFVFITVWLLTDAHPLGHTQPIIIVVSVCCLELVISHLSGTIFYILNLVFSWLAWSIWFWDVSEWVNKYNVGLYHLILEFLLVLVASRFFLIPFFYGLHIMLCDPHGKNTAIRRHHEIDWTKQKYQVLSQYEENGFEYVHVRRHYLRHQPALRHNYDAMIEAEKQEVGLKIINFSGMSTEKLDWLTMMEKFKSRNKTQKNTKNRFERVANLLMIHLQVPEISQLVIQFLEKKESGTIQRFRVSPVRFHWSPKTHGEPFGENLEVFIQYEQGERYLIQDIELCSHSRVWNLLYDVLPLDSALHHRMFFSSYRNVKCYQNAEKEFSIDLGYYLVKEHAYDPQCDICQDMEEMYDIKDFV